LPLFSIVDNGLLRAQGLEVSQEIGARGYKECSALNNDGVDDIFEAATRASMLVKASGSGTASAREDSRMVQSSSFNEKRRRPADAEGQDGGSKCCVVC
jgi:Rho family protein